MVLVRSNVRDEDRSIMNYSITHGGTVDPQGERPA